jgi:hypothetical protein
MDPTVVVAHIDQVYSALGREHVGMSKDDSSPGWAFLRKLVQLPIEVPRIRDNAVDEFIKAALATPPAITPGVRTAIGMPSTDPADRDASPPTRSVRPPAPRPASVSPAVDVIPWRSIEQHPSIHGFLAERINAQPDRSVREMKRMINVWQFYHRVLTRTDPTANTEETIRRAVALVLLSEIITRWPALQPHLRVRRAGLSGFQELIAGAHDDEAWNDAVSRLRLDEGAHEVALQSLRQLLVRYDCTTAAELADRLL